jgi:hypothetical protein
MNHSFLDTIAYAISARSRESKHNFFLRLLAPTPSDTILDVGVNAKEYSDTDNYLERFYAHPEQITAVSLDDVSHLKNQYPRVTFVQADGTKLPFSGQEFTIVFSNAVIEHVGDTASQQAFLNELVRVSKRGYITTPNKFFPFEVHTRTPLLHILLPKKLFDRFLKSIGKEWAAGDYMNLLSKKDLRLLAEQAGVSEFQIYKNRLFGFTMTLTLIWKK